MYDFPISFVGTFGPYNVTHTEVRNRIQCGPEGFIILHRDFFSRAISCRTAYMISKAGKTMFQNRL